MSIVEALRAEAFELPLDRTDEHFPTFMRRVFDNYLQVVEDFSDNIAFNFCKEDALFLSDSIVAAIDAYYNGFPSNAYSCLEEGLNRIISHINLLIDIKVAESGDKLYLYKLRVNGKKELHREDMFHVPFEKREFISMQRYNIPGLPCLYLGNSISVCWEEMQRPDIETIHVSKYELDAHDLHFLDISMTPYFLIDKIQENKENLPLVMAFLTTWPLVAACSVNVLNNNAAFNPEYIIPQLLLQWVRQEKKIDGIKYICTRIKEDFKNRPKTSINYVIPCTEMAEQGFCKFLAEKVRLTEPVSKAVLKLATDEGSGSDCNIIFHKLEEHLNKLELGFLKTN
jgi:hypothetical protein